MFEQFVNFMERAERNIKSGEKRKTISAFCEALEPFGFNEFEGDWPGGKGRYWFICKGRETFDPYEEQAEDCENYINLLDL